MKKSFVALALVVLILAAVTLLSEPNVKADVSEAKVVSYSWYVAPVGTVAAAYIGDLIVVGEVENVGSNTLGYVRVAGTAYNSSGTALDMAVNQAFATDMTPGQKAPFYLDFTPENSVTQDQSWVSSVTTVNVAVVSANDTAQTQYSGLVIPAGGVSAALDATGTYTIKGSVQNTGNQASGNVWVVSTFYNSSGTVVSLNYTFDVISTSLLPGNTATFVATPIDNTAQLSNSITNYSVLVQSLPLTASATPTPTAPSTTQPTSSSASPTHPTQSPRTAVSSGLVIDIVVAAIIVLAVLVALLLVRRHQKNAQFELPPPPPPL